MNMLTTVTIVSFYDTVFSRRMNLYSMEKDIYLHEERPKERLLDAIFQEKLFDCDQTNCSNKAQWD